MAQMTLEELVAQLQRSYGDALRCVVLYGSAARGEHVARKSDLNVLMLVDDVTMEQLRRESAVARSWEEAGNPPPLTLTADEWRSSSDIFPIEYADILAHHRVLHGSLPLDGITVRREDLRLQLEHEAMSKLLRLRHAVLQSDGRGRSLLGLLEASASSMLVLFRATLRLHGEEPPVDSLDVVTRVRARTGIEVDAIEAVLRHQRGVARIAAGDVPAMMERYLGVARGLVRHLDQWRDGEGAGTGDET